MSEIKYPLETVLEMLNGIDNGFSYEQIQYFIYHSLNGNEQQLEAVYFKDLCIAEAKKLNRAVSQLKAPDEIEEIKVIEDLNNLNISNNNVQ